MSSLGGFLRFGENLFTVWKRQLLLAKGGKTVRTKWSHHPTVFGLPVYICVMAEAAGRK